MYIYFMWSQLLQHTMTSVTHRKQFHERSCNKSQMLKKYRKMGKMQNP